MNAETHTADTGFLYEFGDLLLAVIAVAIPLVALPLFLLTGRPAVRHPPLPPPPNWQRRRRQPP